MLGIIKTALISITTLIGTLIPQPTYTEGMVGQPMDLNPLVESKNGIDESIESLVFSGLTKHTVDGDFVGDLAESWDLSEDGKEYTVYLKDGVKFHNGALIKAEDIIYTLSRLKEFEDVEMERVDDRTIKFRLKEPFAPFLELLSTGVVPEDYFESEHSKLIPIGSGDFHVVSVKRDKKVKALVLETKKPEYKIKKIIFKFYDTPQELYEAAKLGDILAFGGLKPLNWENFRQFKSRLKGRYYALFFNLEGNEALKNRDLRRDLARSTDKEAVIKFALNQDAIPIDSPISSTWAKSESVSVYKYRDDLGSTYKVSLSLTVPATLAHLKTADIIKENWSKIGVAIDVRPVPPERIIEEVIKPKDFEVLLFGQEVGVDPDRYAYWHSTQEDFPGLNFSSYEQMRVDKALEEGRKSLDRQERIEHYSNFQRILTADVPAIFLYEPIYNFSVSKKIKGVDLEAFFYPSDRYLDFKNWELE